MISETFSKDDAAEVMLAAPNHLFNWTRYMRMRPQDQDLVSSLETVLDQLPLEDRISRVNRFERDLSLDSFITPLERGIHSSLLIHYKGLVEHFDRLDEHSRDVLRQWSNQKREALIAELSDREKTRTATRSSEDSEFVKPKKPMHQSARRGRRIVVFIDGTRNTPEELRHTSKYDLMEPPPITNVVRLLRGVKTDDQATAMPQVIGYFRGVATDGSWANRSVDAFSGRGLSRIVLDAYRFISHNLEWLGNAAARLGVDEIYIFGFSRGAYAARALTGFLNRFGLIKKESLWLLPFFFEKYQKILANGGDLDARTKTIWYDNVHGEYRSIPVHFLGVWDTVGALGIPIKELSWITIKYEKFHDTSLTPNVTHAYQALAIHELRQPFKPVFWTSKSDPKQIVEQVWFTGAHSNVGGGYGRTGLSSFALDWMAFKARSAGLELDNDYLDNELKSRNIDEPVAISRKKGHGEPGFFNDIWVYPRTLRRPLGPLANVNKYLHDHFPSQQMAPDVFSEIKIHWSVEDRLAKTPKYFFEGEDFRALDKLSEQLPVVDRSEKF